MNNYVEVTIQNRSGRIVAKKVRVEDFSMIEGRPEVGLVGGRPVINSRIGYRVELTILEDEDGTCYTEYRDDH